MQKDKLRLSSDSKGTSPIAASVVLAIFILGIAIIAFSWSQGYIFASSR